MFRQELFSLHRPYGTVGERSRHFASRAHNRPRGHCDEAIRTQDRQLFCRVRKQFIAETDKHGLQQDRNVLAVCREVPRRGLSNTEVIWWRGNVYVNPRAGTQQTGYTAEMTDVRTF